MVAASSMAGKVAARESIITPTNVQAMPTINEDGRGRPIGQKPIKGCSRDEVV